VWGKTCVRARGCACVGVHACMSARLCVGAVCVRVSACRVCLRCGHVCLRCVGTDMSVHVGCGFLQVWCVFAVWVRVYGKDVSADVSLRRYVCEATGIGGQVCVHMGLSGRNAKVMP
jgi:hypothetical protein